MPHDPVGSRVWVNTGCGITPGTVVGDHINTPGVRQITLDGGGLVHAVQAVQQSEGLLELPKDIRLRLYREARQMRQKDKKEKSQSQKALYEKYEEMRGLQETIVRMGQSGYYGDGLYFLEYDRARLRAVTAQYDAMRNEHEQKYGSFNPLNPYNEITSNSGGLENAVQQSASRPDNPPQSKPFKRNHSQSVVRTLRGREEGNQMSHPGYHKYITQRLAALKTKEKELEEQWEHVRQSCVDHHMNIQFWRVDDRVIVRGEHGLHKWAHIGSVQEILQFKSRVSWGYKLLLQIQGSLYLSSTTQPIQYEHEDETRKELWNLAIDDTPETRKLLFDIMLVASEISQLSEQLKK